MKSSVYRETKSQMPILEYLASVIDYLSTIVYAFWWISVENLSDKAFAVNLVER